MFNIIISVILPIIIIASLGALLDHFKPLETSGLSRVAIYLASPALAFSSMANSSIQPGELLDLLLFFVTSSILMTLLAGGICWLIGADRMTTSAIVLSVSLMNMGNYGIPFNEFAFGKPGLERALLVTVVGGFWTYTAGTFIASWGRVSARKALMNVISMPSPYAALIGLGYNFDYISVPTWVIKFSGVLGNAAVPLMLIMLGIQMGRVSLRGRLPLIIGTSLLRLGGGMMVGFIVATLFGLTGLTRQVAIIEFSMPTAVLATVLATEFGSDAELVSGVILVSTILSVLTLSGLLLIL